MKKLIAICVVIVLCCSSTTVFALQKQSIIQSDDDNKTISQSNFDDIINRAFGGNPFGSFHGFNQRPNHDKQRNILANISVEFSDIIHGSEKTVSYNRKLFCEDCKGKKTKEADGISTCSNCRGSGRLIMDHGMTRVNVVCHECEGRGQKITKPCPTCGVRIYKISGCDQMWCTECKVAFSWKTGLIDKGVVHNPHFYQHMKNNNNGVAPRNPHDEVCGGLISVYQLRSNIINKLINFPNISQKISNVHRIISHITYQSLVQSRENVRRYQDFKELRILYILNKKTKAEMATQIYRSDNLRKKYTELLHIDELFSVVGIEVFNTLSNYNGHEFIKEIEFQLSNLNKIRIYCNNEYKKISATYNQKVMNVTDEWIITNNKYKINDYKPNINLSGNNHEASRSNDN